MEGSVFYFLVFVLLGRLLESPTPDPDSTVGVGVSVEEFLQRLVGCCTVPRASLGASTFLGAFGSAVAS